MDNLRYNINFLEFPLWHPVERGKDGPFSFTDIEGFVFTANIGMPSKVDMYFLYYMLLKSQKQDYNRKVSFSQYEILKGCDISPTKERKDRLIKSLEKWANTFVKFYGTFYDNRSYLVIGFNIIDSYRLEQDGGKVEVTLNADWLLKIKESNFFKYISFNEMINLKSPLSLRLYEILSKSFYKNKSFSINVHKLATKIPIEAKYYSRIVEKIKTAVGNINKKTNMQIRVSAKKTGRNNGTLTFTKIERLPKEISENENAGEAEKKEQKERQKEQEKQFNDVLAKMSEDEILETQGEFFNECIAKNKLLLKKYNAKNFQDPTVYQFWKKFIIDKQIQKKNSPV